MLHWVKTLIMSVLLFASITQTLNATSHGDSIQLRVATIERKPFAFQQDGVWIGFAVELWKAIANLNGIKTEFIGTNQFSEMLNAVENGSVDAAAANISITHSREQRMDFSQPIFDAGLLVLMPTTSAPSVFTIIMRKQILLLLISAFGILAAAGGLIAFFERKTPTLKVLRTIQNSAKAYGGP